MKIGLIRSGKKYYSVDEQPLFSYKDEKIGDMSLADPDLIRWDLRQIRNIKNHYCSLKIDDLISIFKKAGTLFSEAKLKIGDNMVSPEEYAELYSLSTGSPISIPLDALKRFKTNFEKMDKILQYQALDEDISAYVNGYVTRDNKTIGWIPRGNNLFVVTPSNHPLVNLLWIIGYAMGYPVILRPSVNDPITPIRLMIALVEAGMPASSLSFYPFQQEYLSELIELFDISMIFGGPDLKKGYCDRSCIKVFGPGNSKIIIDDDYADKIDKITEISFTSMLANSGRGCINLSAIATTRNAKNIAENIALRLSNIEIEDPMKKTAIIGAFKNKEVAKSINMQIEIEIQKNKAIDITSQYRNTPRLIEAFGTTFLLPTVILCQDHKSPLFAKEYPFPFITVADVEHFDLLEAASNSLVVTLLSNDNSLFRDLIYSCDIGKVFRGEHYTNLIDFEDPHEGFISDFLFTKKAIRK